MTTPRTPADQPPVEHGQARAFAALETTLFDLRNSVRVMRKSWVFSAVVVLSLGLGIGANTAIFTLIDTVMWRMLPVKDPQNLLLVGRTVNGNPQTGYTYDQFKALREQTEIAEIAGYSPQRLSVDVDGKLEPTSEGHLVSGNYFSLLGVNAFAGRTIAADDDRIPSGHPVAMLSHRYWVRRFGRDPGVVGGKISISGTPFTIIGIAPPEFFGLEVGSAPDLFVPMMMQPAVMLVSENLLDRPNIYSTWIQALARLRPGIHEARAAAALLPPYAREVPPPKFGGPMPKLTIALNSAATGLSSLRRQFSQPLSVLMALVAMVLLIACANIANLFLARATTRSGEFALRLAIGAGRWRLMRQLLVESVVLALLGGLCAILLARWGTSLLLAYMSAGRNAVILNLNPTLRIVGFTAAVAVATGILFGLAAALRAARLDLAPALKNLRGLARERGGGPRKILAVAQVALSLVLLVGAGWFVRSLHNLNRHDSGFARDRVLIARVEPKGSDQRNTRGTLERLDRIYNELIERVSAIPGVRSASLANVAPTKPESGCCAVQDPVSGERTAIPQVMVYPKYFETLGISLVAGRDFTSADFARNAAPVAVINETLARRRFPGQSPVGLNIGEARIIGIVRDSKYTSLKAPTESTYYMPFLTARTGRGQMILHVRTSIDSNSVRALVRAEVWKADSSVPQFEAHTLAEEVDAVLVQERLIATLSSCLGGLALVLAAIGLYGLLAFGVVQRTAEIGVRMALGALRADVVWMILKEALVLVSIGVAVGVAAALALSRIASSQIAGLLFGLTPGDPVVLSAATALLMAVAVLAAFLPALRAARVDPIVALRNE
jgi:predicted permease